jgi:hypothetical protein
MGHWHIGWNTPGYLPESEVTCLADVEQAAGLLRDHVREAIETLPADSQTPGMDHQYLIHSEWLYLRPTEALVRELEVERWAGRAVYDGRSLPTVYWVCEVAAEVSDCELQAGGEPR